MGKRLKDGFYWRGSVIWTRDPVSGKRTSTGCKGTAAAYLWYDERERLAASPAYRASTTATVGGWVKRVLAIKQQARAEGTAHMYRVKLGHVTRVFGADAPMASVTADAVDGYVRSRRADGAKNNTIARELTCLRQLLRYAKRSGEYAEDISNVMPIGFSAEYVPVTRTLAAQNLPLLFEALRTDQERAWVCMALAFAADAADIHRMRPEDYDEARQLFHVRGTKNRARDAWLPVLPVFRELFDYGLARLPLDWQRASKGVGEACTRAGIPHLSPKDLRRTTITWLAEAGVDQGLASRFARHLGDQMVRKIYAQISPRSLGSLIVAQIGTDQSHQARGPLAEQVDAGDLKGHPPESRRRLDSESSEETAVRNAMLGRQMALTDALSGTYPSQWSETFRARAALAVAAAHVGVIRVAM